MPYIKAEKRIKYTKLLEDLLVKLLATPEDEVDGELNYVISFLLLNIYSPKYFNYNRAMGVLSCIMMEYYRRNISFYEDQKIKENGDL